MFGIEKYRAQNWWITRVSGRMSAQFAIQRVLYPASGVRRHQFEMEHKYVLAMVHRLHKIWFSKVKDLITNKFWCPGGLTTPGVSLLTFRRVLHCRPSCVFYKNGNRGKLRPCRRDRFCPWCWARTAAFAYRLYKRELREVRKNTPGLVLTCRVIEHKLAAEGFHSASGYSPEQAFAQAEKLRAVLEKHRSAYQSLPKQLQRKTQGSAWRLTVNPCDDGWLIEARQLFLAPPKKALPLVSYPGAKTVFRKSAGICDDDAVLEIVGRFFEYPSGLMTSYSELAAVYLQAHSNIRTISGTGVFRAAGQSLVQQIKKAKPYGTRKNQERHSPDEESDSFSADVFM